MEIAFSLVMLAAMAVVAYYDAKYFIIPNWLNLVILAIFPIWYLVSPAPIDIFSALIAFAIFFGIGFLIFALNVMGGGDIKLLAVLGLYTGYTEQAISLVVYTAIFGGLLSIFLICARVMLRRRDKAKTARIFQHNQPIPYGLAIVCGFSVLLIRGTLPGFAEMNLIGLL